MGWPKPVLEWAGRTVLGVLLAGAFSVIGIGIAWGMFVFSGAVSHLVLLTMFSIGAGLGAGVGSLLAWTRIDGIPSKPVLLTAAVGVALAGIVGAWGGYQFGATQDVECCVGPAIEPITYMIGGTTLLANLAALVMAVAYDFKIRRGALKIRSTTTGSAIGAPGEARHSPN